MSKDIEFQIIEWFANDEEIINDEDSEEYSEYNANYIINIFGVTNDNKSITCKITNFSPFYYIKVNDNFDNQKLILFLNFIKDKLYNRFRNSLITERCKIIKKKDIYGFNNNKYFKFVKLVFKNYTTFKRSRYIFKEPIYINGVTKKLQKFKLFESNVEPFMRFSHIKNILSSGWVILPKNKYTILYDYATTKLQVSIDRQDIISNLSNNNITNFLQASWDIETYSCDYTFPDPKNIKNTIYQIATTLKYTNENNVIKYLFTLKKCAKIEDENVKIIECKDEKDLIKKWVIFISEKDPDVMYTYNGDCFDANYLLIRSELFSLKDFVLEKLSRLKNVKSEIKHEIFSSSAYGDSDYNRLYIPGRLNYDLLIYYKRGMKKYPSYKLDYIANEILKEGKHDVSAKDIFKAYEIGTPELIRKISLYCIQDTVLLQKLVDKQMILTNIIQLANVTYIPIGYLNTRGQTIKVFSQVLRKARQMNFLVQHTNFNEDSYDITIETKNNHNILENDIDEYITINTNFKDYFGKPKNKICGKITKIIDEKIFTVSIDNEISNIVYNVSYIFNSKKYDILKMYPTSDTEIDSFTGAYVLDAQTGFHKDNIAILDYASLYPTVQMSNNLCFSTLVLNEKYLNLPNVKYETYEWDDSINLKLKQTCNAIVKAKGTICGKQAFYEIENNYYCRVHDPLKKDRAEEEKFQKQPIHYKYTVVQSHIDENGNIINKGVIPSLLEELYSERKKVKKQMGIAYENGDKNLADILNSTQLAIKISLNSVYGFLSRGQGNLTLKALGQLTTYKGRCYLNIAKDYMEQEFVNYLQNNNYLKYKLTYKPTNLSESEKNQILEKFKKC